MRTNVRPFKERSLLPNACSETLKPLTEFILGEEALLDTSLNGHHRASEASSAQARDCRNRSGNRPDLIQALGFERHYDCAGEVQKDGFRRHEASGCAAA
jgi:hypothetical protein